MIDAVRYVPELCQPDHFTATAVRIWSPTLVFCGFTLCPIGS
jgi:hypothetical protein